MPVALTWLLDQRDLGLRLLTPGPVVADIDWAHAIELEDPSPWLTGGELVMTTGLRLSRRRAEQVAYVDRLADVGVAAVAFGVGVRFAHVPAAVADRCEQRGLPLIEVPLPTPFIAVTQRVAQQLAHEQQQALQRLVKAQQTITRRSLRHGAPGLVEGLATELRRDVVLLDEHGRPLGSSPGRALGDSLSAVVRAGRPAVRQHATRRVVTPAGPVELHALSGRAAHRGWLAVGLGDALPADDRLLVNHAVAVATLKLDRPREVEQARAAVGDTVLRLLLAGRPSPPAVVGLLTHLGFDPEDRVRVVWVPTAAAAALADAVLARLEPTGTPHAVHAQAHGLVVLIQDREEAEGTVTVVRRSTLDADPGAPGLGVSAPVPADTAADALAQAVQAAAAAAEERHEAVWFDRLALGALLSDPVLRDRVQSLTRPVLDMLAQGGDTVLVNSLRVFLEHNGTWESAARALRVHRHTLRNRMTRVEELTGLDLEASHNRMVLHLALATRPPSP